MSSVREQQPHVAAETGDELALERAIAHAEGRLATANTALAALAQKSQLANARFGDMMEVVGGAPPTPAGPILFIGFIIGFAALSIVISFA